MTTPYLRVQNLTCVRGGRPLFRGVNLDIKAGEIALLHGPNGIGKSSLIRVCAGLLPAYSGSVQLCGQVALVDERLALDLDLPLYDSLQFWAKLDQVAPRKLDQALDAMALSALASVPVRMLSTGQRKRAALVRLIASSADIWLLDEPTNGLDDHAIGLLSIAVKDHISIGGLVIGASHQPLPFSTPNILSLTEFIPTAERRPQ